MREAHHILLFFLSTLPQMASTQTFFDTTYLAWQETIDFASDQSQFFTADTQKLMTLLEKAKQFDSSMVEIHTHADADGAHNYNLRLSRQRAVAIKRFLISAGYDSADMRIQYHGDEMRMFYAGYADWHMLYPQATSPREQRLNRRVELQLCTCEKSSNTPNPLPHPQFPFYVLTGKSNLFQ